MLIHRSDCAHVRKLVEAEWLLSGRRIFALESEGAEHAVSCRDHRVKVGAVVPDAAAYNSS